MFDPYHIGRLDRNNVEVINIIKNAQTMSNALHWQPFKAIVFIQGHKHAMICKPNRKEKRDQIVADRLKYLFKINPMHTVGVKLNFIFIKNEVIDCDFIEYFMFASSLEDIHNEIEPLTLDAYFNEHIGLSPMYLWPSYAFELELMKIIAFRYIIGNSTTHEKHILIKNDMPLSISETHISSATPQKTLHPILKTININVFKDVQSEFQILFDRDYMRGIILQTRQPEQDLKHLRPKGSITVKATRIAEIMEERYDIITTCKPKDMLNLIFKIR